MSAPLRLLFVCVENSCRSQMAQAFARRAGHEAYSAGSRPSGVINPKASASMAALGIELSGQHSKGVADLPAVAFDAVVTMGCGDACPAVPARLVEDWAIPDPKDMDSAAFAEVRDQLGAEVLDLIRRLTARAEQP